MAGPLQAELLASPRPLFLLAVNSPACNRPA